MRPAALRSPHPTPHPMPHLPAGGRLSDAELDHLQRQAFSTFLHPTNEIDGLFRDRGDADAPCSTACCGLALTCYVVGVERGWMSRDEAVERTTRCLRFFDEAPQGDTPDTTGHRGIFYHFLDMRPGETFGRRVWGCELSTLDTAMLVLGMLTVAEYFGDDGPRGHTIRDTAWRLYRRIDWSWACGRAATVAHGWTPEKGFLKHRWANFDECLLMYPIACGSPTHPATPAAWPAVMRGQELTTLYDLPHLHAGPLFIHQYPHAWIDFAGLLDDFWRGNHAAQGEGVMDYVENARRAGMIQRQFASENPHGFVDYGENLWGFTACEGPGPGVRRVHGRRQRFHAYKPRGVPYGPDDGTIAPWAAAAHLPFCPVYAADAVRHAEACLPDVPDGVGWKPTVNPSWRIDGSPGYWVARDSSALHDGPIVLGVENARSGLIHRLTRRITPIADGLRAMGFAGGWLEKSAGG